MTSVTCQQIKAWIEVELNGASATVTGDGTHFKATVICPQFAGKSLLMQHRMVYAALNHKMEKTIHALSLKTSAFPT